MEIASVLAQLKSWLPEWLNMNTFAIARETYRSWKKLTVSTYIAMAKFISIGRKQKQSVDVGPFVVDDGYISVGFCLSRPVQTCKFSWNGGLAPIYSGFGISRCPFSRSAYANHHMPLELHHLSNSNEIKITYPNRDRRYTNSPVDKPRKVYQD